MAKFRRKARTSGRRFGRRSRGRSTVSGMSPLNVAMAGAVYGFGRPIIANMVPNFFQIGPVDSDNALIAGAGYYGLKNGRGGFVKALSAIALGSEVGMVTAKATSGTTNTVGDMDLNKIDY